MQKWIFASLLMLLTMTSWGQKAKTYQKFKMDNGLKVLLVENNDTKMTQIQTSFRLLLEDYAQSSDEIVLFLRVALEADKKEKRSVLRQVQGWGGTIELLNTGAIIVVPNKKVATTLELLSDRYLNFEVTADEYKRVQKRTLIDLEDEALFAPSILEKATQKIVYQGYPLNSTITHSSIKATTSEMVNTFAKENIFSNIMEVVVESSKCTKKIKPLVENAFGARKSERRFRNYIKKTALPTHGELSVIQSPNQYNKINYAISYPIRINNADDEIQGVEIIDQILRDRLNGNNDDGFKQREHWSQFYWSGDAEKDNWKQEANKVLSAMQALLNQGITQTDIDKAKQQLLQQNAMYWKEWLRRACRYNVDENWHKDFKARYDLPVERVNQIAQEYLQPAKAYTLVLGVPIEDQNTKDGFEKAQLKYYNVEGEKIALISSQGGKSLTAEEIINNYIEAIGGKAQWQKVETIKEVRNIISKGSIVATVWEKNGLDDMRLSIYRDGDIQSIFTYKGEEGVIFFNGRDNKVKDVELLRLMYRGVTCSELYLDQLQLKVQLGGVVEDNGRDLAKLRIQGPGGFYVEEFYDTETSLKTKTVEYIRRGDNVEAKETRYSQYEQYGDIRYPVLQTTVKMTKEEEVFQLRELHLNGEFKVKG